MKEIMPWIFGGTVGIVVAVLGDCSIKNLRWWVATGIIIAAGIIYAHVG